MRALLLALVSLLGLPSAGLAQQQFAERPLRRYLPLLDGAEGIAFLDIEGDGDEDLALIADGARLFVLVNHGGGAFTDESATRVPPPPGFLRGIASGDIDGDGDFDLATGDTLLVNDGQGVFADRSSTRLPPGSPPGGDVELGDLDGDDDLDLVFTPYLASGQRFYFNTGTGVFDDRTSLSWPGPSLYGNLELGDVDGDGDLDLLTSPFTPLLFENDGSGVFTDVSAQRLPSFTKSVVRERFLDADLDGDLDILLAEHTGSDVLWRNDGLGTFTEVPGSFPPAPGFGGDTAVGDIDGDGDPDVARGTRGRTRLYRNDGTGLFEEITPRLPYHYNGDLPLEFEDVDGDGDADLYAGAHHLMFNDWPGDFYEAPSARFDNLSGVALAAADLNGDGAPDVVTGGGFNGFIIDTNYVHLSAAPGTPYTKRSLGAFNTWALATGDVDGDGDVDLVEGNSTISGYTGVFTYRNRLHLNDGTGSFSVSAGLPEDTDDTKAVLLLDTDGDGDLDLMSGNYAQPDRIHVNQGHGTFQLAPDRLPVLATVTYGLACGDVDADGDLDVVTAAYGAQNRLYLNNGSGWFEDASAARMPLDNATSHDVELGDVDGDGDLDAVVANNSDASALYLNDGNGVFSDASSRIPGSVRAWVVSLADVEQDGDLDIVFGRNVGARVRLFLNDGGGTFSDASQRLPAFSDDVADVLLADLERDRDPELLVALGPAFSSSYPASHLSNLHRQLEAPLFAVLGRTYELEVHAEPGYASGQRFAAIALSFDLLAPPLPAPPPLRGTLFLQGPLRTIPLVTVPMAGGRATVALGLPNDPALLDVTFYAQAAILGAGKPQLTGYVVDTIRR